MRGLGHHLEPVVHVGKDGLSKALLAAAKEALEQHELIKVKLGEAVDGERSSLGKAMADALSAELAQVLGRTVLLYRKRREDPKIRLPA